jgi:hypothetical protein
MRKYPTSLQDFEKIINTGCLYVDKTEYISNLVNPGGYYFLSRPRRFGKSILTTTMKALFEGKKDLFKGLHIYDKWEWKEKYAVIHISFAKNDYVNKGLYKAIFDNLHSLAHENNIALAESTIGAMFYELIKKLNETVGKVAVIVDEYDKPINNYLGTNTSLALENRDILKSFYSVLKDSDPFVKFVFITGVSKFAKVSIFSDLNNLYDISLDYRYSSICGINEEEIEANFAEELKEIDRIKMKEWYNGYTWDLKTWVYNPFLLILFMESRQFKNYWYDSGTPTFLINALKSSYDYDFKNRQSTEIQLSTLNIEKTVPITLMFQTGYLTFVARDEVDGVYTLDYPNREVEQSFNEMLLDAYINTNSDSSMVSVNKLRKALTNEDFDEVTEIINNLFKSIPYTLWSEQSESFYHAILHLTFRLLGIHIQSEQMTSNGRLDSILHFPDKIYCLEFKLDKSATEALNQIKKKGYLDPYKNDGRKRIAIGINFSKKDKAIDGILWEEV